MSVKVANTTRDSSISKPQQNLNRPSKDDRSSRPAQYFSLDFFCQDQSVVRRINGFTGRMENEIKYTVGNIRKETTPLILYTNCPNKWLIVTYSLDHVWNPNKSRA